MKNRKRPRTNITNVNPTGMAILRDTALKTPSVDNPKILNRFVGIFSVHAQLFIIGKKIKDPAVGSGRYQIRTVCQKPIESSPTHPQNSGGFCFITAALDECSADTGAIQLRLGATGRVPVFAGFQLEGQMFRLYHPAS